jgi:hypothetical protein
MICVSSSVQQMLQRRSLPPKGHEDNITTPYSRRKVDDLSQRCSLQSKMFSTSKFSMLLMFIFFLYVRIGPCYSTGIISNGNIGNTDVHSFNNVVIGDSNANGTIVVGYLMDQLRPPYRIGALSMAIRDWQASGLLPGYNFR